MPRSVIGPVGSVFIEVWGRRDHRRTPIAQKTLAGCVQVCAIGLEVPEADRCQLD